MALNSYGFVYILELRDGSYYTGSTTDIRRRVEEHNRGIGSHYVFYRKPFKLVYLEKTRSFRKREREIKRMSKTQKLELILKYRDRTVKIAKEEGIEIE